MELLDRYLNFTRFWLPRGKQQDIIAELSEDLHGQIADREAELGRTLDEAELEALLKRCGHPLMVAARYQVEQQLIGPPIYPLYLFALKLVAWVLFPLLLVVGALIAVFRTHPIAALIGSVGDAFAGAIYMVGLITLLCAVLERLQVKLDVFKDWRPRDLPKLPVVPDPIQIPRGESFGGFVGLLVFTLWWVGAFQIPEIPHVHLLQPLPQTFFLPVLALVIAEMTLHVVNLFLPWWTRRRAAARLVLDIASLGLIAALFFGWPQPWFVLQVDPFAPGDLAKLAPADLTRIDQVVNLSLLICFAIGAVSYVLRGVQDTLRMFGKPPLQTWLLSRFTR
jgi:hypothetical protein